MSHVLDFIQGQPWCLTPTAFGALFEVLLRRADGIKLDRGEIEAIVAQAGERKQNADEQRQWAIAANGVAVLPIKGHISRYASLFGDISGPRGTSVDSLRQSLAQIRAAVNAGEVGSVLLDFDSPGGTAAGVADLADEIFALGQSVPITAYAGETAASAAYWLASQAKRVLVGQTGVVGSIGVYVPIHDASRAAKNNGVDLTVVKAGDHKGPDAFTGGINERILAEIKAEIDELREVFVAAVARGRGMDTARASGLGDGSEFMGKRAVEVGLADAVATFADALEIAGGDAAKALSVDRRRGAGGLRFAMGNGERSMSDQAETPVVQEPQEPKATTDTSAILKEGAQGERERARRILAAAEPEQHELAQQLIGDGVPLAAALEKLNGDIRVRHAEALAELRGSRKSVGVDDADEAVSSASDPVDAFAKLTPKEQWKASAYIQKRFIRAEIYEAKCAREDDFPSRDFLAFALQQKGGE